MKNILLDTAVTNIVVGSECGDIRTKDQVWKYTKTKQEKINKILLETVVVKLVVGPKRRQSSHSDAVGKEDLSGAVDPGGSFFKLRPKDHSTFTDIVL